MMVVDSNVWIFAEVKEAPEHSTAIGAIRSLISSSAIGINVVIVSEVFHKIAKFFDAARARERVGTVLLHPSVQWIQFDQESAADATALASAAGIRINDALIAQQALEQKVPVLTDNVRDFKKLKGLKVVSLR